MFEIVPTVLSQMRAMETKACLDSTTQTQLLPAEKTLQWWKDNRPIRSHSKQRNFVKELKQLQVDGAEIWRDAKKLEEEMPDGVNSFEARWFSISENRKYLKERLKKCSKQNKVINGYDAKEYQLNQILFINDVALMVSLPMFIDCELKPQDMPWSYGNSLLLEEPLASTGELMHVSPWKF